MELVGHRAMTSDARLLRDGGAASVRLVTQATYLLVTGPTAIVDAEEIDEEVARWLEDDSASDAGAAIVVLGAGASGVAASGERVTLGPDGRGGRRLPGASLAAGAEIAVDTADAGTVTTRLPAQAPAAWIEIDGARRPLALRPIALRIDLVGLRLSIAWAAAAPVSGPSDDARLVVHTDAPFTDDAPRSTRASPAARPVPVMRRAAPSGIVKLVDPDPEDDATRPDVKRPDMAQADGTRPDVKRPDVARPAAKRPGDVKRRDVTPPDAGPTTGAGPHEWDVDSTVSIDGTAPASLPLPFQSSQGEPPRRPGSDAAAPSRPPRLAPPPPAGPEERRSIGQILAGRGDAPAAVADRPAPAADASRAGRARMGERAAAPDEAPRPAARTTEPPLLLLHVDAGASARLRRPPRWRAMLAAPSRAAQRAAEEAGEDAAGRDARDAVAALLSAPTSPLDALAAELGRAVDDGLLVPPLLAVEGELELPLDEVELLRAMVEAVAPLRGVDRRVEEALDRARPFVDAPWLDPAVAEAERAHLRGIVAGLGRGQTAEALDAQIERKLRRERKHASRTWRGTPWVIGALTADGHRVGVLLPRAAVDVLPIARRFRARLIVEAQPSIEPDVGDAPTLFALAIAREVAVGPAAADQTLRKAGVATQP